MNLLTAEHLKKSYTERLLFDDVAFSIVKVIRLVSSALTEPENLLF